MAWNLESKIVLWCVPLGWSGSASVIRDHSDHGRSNEPMNPLWTRIHWFIWSVIRVISDHWSWSWSSQRNAPLDSLTWGDRFSQGIVQPSRRLCREALNASFSQEGRVGGLPTLLCPGLEWSREHLLSRENETIFSFPFCTAIYIISNSSQLWKRP